MQELMYFSRFNTVLTAMHRSALFLFLCFWAMWGCTKIEAPRNFHYNVITEDYSRMELHFSDEDSLVRYIELRNGELVGVGMNSEERCWVWTSDSVKRYTLVEDLSIMDYFNWNDFPDTTIFLEAKEEVNDITCLRANLILEDSSLVKIWYHPEWENTTHRWSTIPGLPIRIESESGMLWEYERTTPGEELSFPKLSELNDAQFIHPHVWIVSPLFGTLFNENINIDLGVKDISTQEYLPSKITLYKGDSLYFEHALDSGLVDFYLPFDGDYEMLVSSKDYTPKKLRFELGTLPREFIGPGYTTVLDVNLFKAPEGFIESIMEQPLGILRFDSIQNGLEWDMEYTRMRNEVIRKELERAVSTDSSTP